MDSDEVHALAKRMQLAFDGAGKMQAVLEHARQFAADDNLTALQRWTMHADSGAQVRMITLDGRPRISVYRRVNSRIPGSGFRDAPDTVSFDESVRQPLAAIPGDRAPFHPKGIALGNNGPRPGFGVLIEGSVNSPSNCSD